MTGLWPVFIIEGMIWIARHLKGHLTPGSVKQRLPVAANNISRKDY